jgi:hypothetical protein
MLEANFEMREKRNKNVQEFWMIWEVGACDAEEGHEGPVERHEVDRGVFREERHPQDRVCAEAARLSVPPTLNTTLARSRVTQVLFALFFQVFSHPIAQPSRAPQRKERAEVNAKKVLAWRLLSGLCHFCYLSIYLNACPSVL